MVWITTWSHTLRSATGPLRAIPITAGVLGLDARCGPQAARAGLALWAGTMELHPEACASLGTRASLASLGQPIGICG